MIHLKARTIDSELVFVHCVALRQIDEKFFIPLPGESLSLYYYLKSVTLYIRTLLSFFRLFAFLSFSRPRCVGAKIAVETNLLVKEEKIGANPKRKRNG